MPSHPEGTYAEAEEEFHSENAHFFDGNDFLHFSFLSLSSFFCSCLKKEREREKNIPLSRPFEN